ncbi:MAG: AbrB/MazE/SpoVT family DNA-binding domain-containing protein [Anaerolineales bacterium]|nr:AbrB/MazE/SpoVT family DNA-binding domain-containing protein [Anaerolineales bacterium]
MITIKVGRRGQITLPRLIRKQFGLQEGDRIAIMPQEDQAIIRPLPQTLLDLRGSVPVSAPQDFSAIRQQVIIDHLQKAVKDEN